MTCFVASVAAGSSSSSSPTPSSTLSGCQVCATTQDCSHAYIGSPGQFCGDWLDTTSQRQSCCCPRESTCKRTTYSCKCSEVATATTTSPEVSTYGWVGIAIGSAVFLSCCVGGCWFVTMMAKKASRRPPPPAQGAPVVMMATPVAGGVPGYNVAPAPMVYAATAPPVYNYGYGGGGYGGGGGGMSSGLSTALGFGAGMMIGNALGDHGGFGGGFDGGDGGFGGDGGGFGDGGGGFDGGGGDFSGDF